uniref:Nuclear pore complex protein Nup98-Nup96 n=1 Tax=Sinocyclocheilus grahami TaxID=75366 RepID=A0A672RRU3_SINGR
MFNKSFGAPFGGGTGGFGTTSTFGQQNAGFGATGGFGSSAFGTTNNTGGLFGTTQNKPGGLFGSSTFSQPVTSSTSTGFGFGATSGTPNSLFGSTNTGGGGLFSQQNNAFAANKPTTFGTFGTSTSSGGLFGTTNTTSNPFGGTSGSLFGSSNFTAAPPGTTIKFNPPTGSDTMVKGGVTTSINTKHQCITAMKEYENKSLEELRLEDYQAGRKGPSNPMAAGTGGLFGAAATATPSTGTGLFGASTPNTGFSFGQNKTSFGTSKWLIVTLHLSCLIEMAKRVANILRVVLSLQQGGEGTPDPRHIPLCQLAPHIGRLPMPEDYALEELRSLTQSYLQEYVISH